MLYLSTRNPNPVTFFIIQNQILLLNNSNLYRFYKFATREDV